VSLLPPLRPIPFLCYNCNPLLIFLGIAFICERILQPYPRSSVGNRPADNTLPNFPGTAIVPGSWAYELRGEPNEEFYFDIPNEDKDSW